MGNNTTSWTTEKTHGYDNTTTEPYYNTTAEEYTVTEEPVDECKYLAEIDNDIFVIYFYCSLGVTVLMCFIIRRKQCCQNCCWRRPGFIQPLDFVDDIGRRWAYAACFVLITYYVLTLFQGESLWDLLPKDDPEWLKKYGFVKVFNKLFEALSVTIVFYPLLACINHRRHFVANLIGFGYALPWIVFHSLIFDACPVRGEEFDVEMFIFRIPIYIAFYIVIFSYILDFCLNVRRIWKRYKKIGLKDPVKKKRKTCFKMKHHLEYVNHLLNKKPKEEVEGGNVVKRKLLALIKKVTYDAVPGFRYPLRLVCSITICLTLQIWFVIMIALEIEGISLIICAYTIASELDFLVMICGYMLLATILAHVANAIAGAMIIGMLINTLISYKRRWHQLLRGDHSWRKVAMTLDSPPSILLSGLKFAGFQVAFLIWGWAVLALVIFIVIMFLTFALFIPLHFGYRNWLINILISIWPTLLLGIIIIPLIQKLICRFAFLQNRGSTLAIDNRRIYNGASYYFLILNILAGIFSCLKRILVPLVLGILFLSRLDQPLIMSGFETMDPGYVSFVSMLLVDLYHNHPIVKTFIYRLNQGRADNSGDDDSDSNELKEKNLRSKMLRNRWRKVVTLVNNPSLVSKFIEQRFKDKMKSRRQETLAGITIVEDLAMDDKESLSEKDSFDKDSINRDDLINTKVPEDDQLSASSDQSNVEISSNRDLLHISRL